MSTYTLGNIVNTESGKYNIKIFYVEIELYQHARLLANERSAFTNAIL